MQHKIIITDDGSHTIYIEELGEHYHSTFGAIGESMHVYINNVLKPALINNQTIDVLEIGFGTGLNAFLSLIEATNQKVKVNYTTLEPYPISKNLIDQLNYPELVKEILLHKEFYKIHQAEWNKLSEISTWFNILKINKKFQEVILPENNYDVVYFDAFAPDIQPDLWTSEVFSKIYMLMKNNSALMTYSAKGIVKRALKSAGFIVQNMAGPVGKREITKALKVI